MNSQTRKNGRPTKRGQLEIDQVLRPYFEQNITASTTAVKTGINPKTVNKRFDSWTQKMSEAQERDFIERQRKDRIRIITSYDNQILDANKHLDDINNEITRLKKEEKPIPMQLFSLRLDAMKYRSYLTERKGTFLMQPIVDEALEKKIAELIKKNENARPDS